MKKLPYLLVLLRLLLGLSMVGITCFDGEPNRYILLSMLTVGLLSDIFDGIIARHVGVATALLRRLDSQVDLVFWLSAGFSIWLMNPSLIEGHMAEITTIFIMEGLTYLFSILKFGKETCTHAWLSKLWGLTLFAAMVGMLGFGYAGITFYTCFVTGIVAHLDVYLIILLLPKWEHDVPSCWHAWMIRKGVPFRKHKWFN